MIEIEKVKEISALFNPQMIEFCQRLIRTPSLPGEEEAVSELFLEEMKLLGYDEVFRDRWGNITGVIRGTEPGPAIMYNGHLDHVDPGDRLEWGGYDPYGAEIDECPVFDQNLTLEEIVPVIHGRGSADLKGGAAAQVYAGGILVQLRKEGCPIRGTFIISMVSMEENGEMLGMLKLLDETFAEKGIHIDGMVNCEPSSLKIMLGHRGRVELKVTVFGSSCHGSSPWLGVNAVTKAAKLILEIEKAVWSNGHEDKDLGRSGIALTIIECEPAALCIVPDKCHITYDRRLVPGETVEGAIAEIQHIIDRLSEEDEEFKAAVKVNSAERRAYTGAAAAIESQKEVWKIEAEHPFVQACAKGLEDAGQIPQFGYWSFSTDIPAVGARMKKPVIGYSGMQEFYIHRPIEKVRIDYLEKSLVGNVSMFLRLVQLPKEVFQCE
ncbi:M20/M25/M40 family metallo-hydrolase [Sinanaerobacter chloroacetimidivorans]|nr:M20/M25/M40 family metallo-hydrolase [Sinanaerobacter chloroacetimidivorans]